ncbi:MAG TPA: flagellar basal body L-ring protein FlgH [Rubrivivax sp.]|jgi:flagellar L-ring protein precursor FlgH|nr:flagellar basal body L-ring protein FlgH [Rubrivivax sp.]
MRLAPALCLFAALPLGGCLATIQDYMYPRVQMADTGAGRPQPPVVPVPQPNGAIFNPASYRPLFEDHRARLVGDTLTVQIVEKVAASQKSTSSIDRGGSIDAGITAFPGVKSTSFGRAALSGSSSNAFEGKGTTESSNDFTGTITVVVREVLPNGHLLVAGEKQIGVNANVDVLRFTGQLDPRSIQPGNAVSSTQIANVRLEHRGRGAQADAQAIGWLARVFLSILPI